MRILLLALALFFAISLEAQEDKNNILTALTQDSDDNIIILLERLDTEVNYIIKVGQFWCAPCRWGVRSLMSQKELLKEKYNTEVIILEQQYFDRQAQLQKKKQAYNWNFPMYTLKSGYGFFGVSGIPDYFFVKAGDSRPSAAPPRGCSSLSLFLEKELGLNAGRFILDKDFTQILSYDCETSKELTLETPATIEFEDNVYTMVNSIYLREDEDNNRVVRYENSRTNAYLDYNLDLCNEFRLVDFEGDFMIIQIIETYEKEGRTYMVTDKVISNSCGEEIPFVIIEGIGTNGGLLFDIENEKVISRLLCHQNADDYIYVDEDLSDWCGPSATSSHANASNQVYLSPNPTNQYVTLNSGTKGKINYSLVNIAGASQGINGSFSEQVKIEVAHLPAGIYQFIFEQEGLRWVTRFVKQ